MKADAMMRVVKSYEIGLSGAVRHHLNNVAEAVAKETGLEVSDICFQMIRHQQTGKPHDEYRLRRCRIGVSLPEVDPE